MMRRLPKRQRHNTSIQTSPILKLILGGSIVLGMLVWFFQLKHTSVFLNHAWRTNFVLRTSPVVVISFPKTSGDKILLVTLPDNVYVTVPYGYGPYRLDTVWKLGNLEKNPVLFSKTTEDLLGISIRSAIGNDQAVPLKEVDEHLLETFKQQVSPLFVLSNSTGLNVLDRLILALKMVNLTANNSLVFLAHKNSRLFVGGELVDGTAIKLPDVSVLTSYFEQKFEESQVRRDSLSIELYNTTQTPDLGNKFARFISNFGGKIVSVKNETKHVDICEVETDTKNFTKEIAQFLREEFKCNFIASQSTSGVDVIIRVGEVFSKRWPGK